MTDNTDGKPVFGPINAWSHSRLDSYERCPYSVYINGVKGIKEPQGEAAARGEAVHKSAEDFVKGDTEVFPPEFRHFEIELRRARELFAEGKAEVEGEWGFDWQWNPVGWMVPETWCRIKLDLLIWDSETSAKVVDHKTGRKTGNELKHKQQGILYAIGTFMRYIELEFLEVEFWYVDQAETMKATYTRAQALKFLPSFTKRGLALTTAEKFPPTPSPSACRFCTYGKGEFPECKFGVNV